MDLNSDFFDMIAALQEEDADFLVVGAFGVERCQPNCRRGPRWNPSGSDQGGHQLAFGWS